ncbi:hypothetical protein HPO_01652 [Hyphomonas polymorpha PS728]|uniref:Lipoprotein n=1 Tax=Hyphomonas polymorpha PS728 TaxID=1280954 RepID=A0A062VHZ0_9PROT|nr:hypothetical protein [Hyphomonas polymorpha]KDA00078.1 hypothetical protein HPO_01652 [Hyphomonas polymorpha PS728]
MFHRAADTPDRKTARRPLRSALCAGLCAAIAGPAAADDLTLFLEDFSAVISKVQLARTITLLCNERDPEYAAARSAKTEAWESENEVALFDTLIEGVATKYSQLRPELESIGAQARTQILPQLEAEPEACGKMDELLAKEDMTLRPKIRSLLQKADDLGVRLDSAAPEAPPEIIPLSRLSAMLLDLMEEVAPAEEASANRKTREARGDYAETWLQARGPLSTFGRVISQRDLREWRGDHQSRYTLSCRSFANDAEETAFAAAAGENRVVTGRLRHFVETQDGGTITLDACTLAPAKLQPALMLQPEDVAGLVDRPLDVSEAYAGPRAGPSMRSIDRVIYDADFSTRMDGFGNGYVDRNEAIYVLQKDGSAFLHEWPFPVTDVNTDLLRKREPGKWYKWSARGKDIVLRPADGGEILILKAPARLRPIGNGARLDKEYYYLQIAMMGARSDRSYAFRQNGELDFTRSGFVAGNIGASYIIVSGGKGDDRQTGQKYRFEDYALIIETAEGEERQFFAIRDGDKPAAPEEIFVKGEVYWEKGKEE